MGSKGLGRKGQAMLERLWRGKRVVGAIGLPAG